MNVDKATLRASIVAHRATLSTDAVAAAATAVSEHLIAAVGTAGATRVCAYVPVGAEPGSIAALDLLRRRGVDVLLPVLRTDLDLDWASYDDEASLVAAAHGLRQPSGEQRGLAAIASAHLVIVPALAVDRVGNRLGRGGGSYDRALARVSPDVPVIALLHDGEILAAVPSESHDRRVTHVVTPTQGWQPVTAPTAQH